MMWLRAFISVLWITFVLAEKCEVNQDGTCVVKEDRKNTSSSECKDAHPECGTWKHECDSNPIYMLRTCPESCGVCRSDQSVDMMIQAALKKSNTHVDPAVLETPFGIKQDLAEGTQYEEPVRAIVDATKKYYEEKVMVDPSYKAVRAGCKNKHPLCSYLASIGRCDADAAMMLECAPACQMCDKLSYEVRCPWDKDGPHPTIFKPGDVDKMFERITTDPFYERFQPQIVSKPPEGPWLVTMDNFLSPEECERLIKLGSDLGYQRSVDVGERRADGTRAELEYSGRTSTHAWCSHPHCYNDPLTQQVLQRIENVTGVPDAHAEYLQLLRYGPTQLYNVHHDYIDFQMDRAEGARILTVFLYLNDVEKGGETSFPKLDIRIHPKQGRVAIWPNVLNGDPNAEDSRMSHEALPVEEGTKYGANAWLHQRDFKDPYHRACL